MQSEAASWADSTMFMLQSEGRAEFIRESIEKSRDYDLLRLGTKPDMINYWIPMNYIHALVDYYYGGDLDMTEAQKDWAICDEIYNNFYKNGHYLNELMMSGSRMAGNIRFMGTKYADDRAANIFLERYMQLTCPQGITRTLTGATLLEAIHLVATDSKTDILLDIKGDWAKARDILKGNFEEVGPLWEHNSRMVAISPSIRQPFDPREVETHFGNIYSLPTDEEYELLDDLLDASQQRTAPANTWSR
ncbi:MAG: hypothetical protein LBT45_02600 [Rickettsiales bacterium]|nr:hypothetical protein [Rickettsiales bacterium]